MIFDSHAHLVSDDVVTYPPSPLTGKLTPGEYDDPMTAGKLLDAMDGAGVGSACAVQRAHVYGYNNRYVLDSAAASGGRLRAVPVLDCRDPHTPATIAAMVREEGIAGVRFASPTFPDTTAEWIAGDNARSSWRACLDNHIPVCIHTLHVQRDFVVPLMIETAKDFPDLPVIVDHVGGAHASHVERKYLAALGRESVAASTDDLKRMADQPNLVMKVSTINLESVDSPAALIRHLVALFGAGRLIWGSDVGQSRAHYKAMVNLVRNAVSGLPLSDQQAILHDNASRLYGASAGRA
ncbi:MAG: amidohydrolase [Sphingomonadaceae bacterium]|nr:amidohydrolase [Sphingomonadaceae bacterium]